jgi:hypothetical protein
VNQTQYIFPQYQQSIWPPVGKISFTRHLEMGGVNTPWQIMTAQSILTA